ncbi:MAG TPA: hypothetical protein PKY77_20780 [Phycisphaerae bacterium]|nr:hypothetical protein [Phycisphaerae bacterium]HRY71190.1 hypothetical protein [Phycisphaerae bacterium]HSA29498.1 hypothetical protein [Phycisphaerae bacterium]
MSVSRATAVVSVILSWAAATAGDTSASRPAPPTSYPDGRPAAARRMEARDQGVVLHHGDGPDRCDLLGARDCWCIESGGTYYLTYDAAGPKGWLTSLAVSKDLVHWKKRGPLLDFGKPGEMDSASASYGVIFPDGGLWHMFYLGTPNTTPAPDLIPALPYVTMKASSDKPEGPWRKQPEVVPFRPRPNTYYSATASPGHVVKHDGEYLQFFSASGFVDKVLKRTIGIARTKDLNGRWVVDDKPIVPLDEQIENTSLHYEPANKTWFLFTNHIGIDERGAEYTDAVWVYWTRDLLKWNAADKAVVLDGANCAWSNRCIGLPTVLKVGRRLAVIYDAPGGNSISHMKRDVGLAWLELPLIPPETGP